MWGGRLRVHNDLTFFTNEPGATLLERFKKTLKHVQFFDVLVGYFRTSGFYNLYEALAGVEKIRILVGLNIDQKAYEIIETYRDRNEIYFESHKNTRGNFSRALVNEMDNSEDNHEVEIGVKKFIEFLSSGKMEIKAYPSANIHAKVYISRFTEEQIDYGRVITGSSNFSESGLIDNYEFNVELKNSADVDFALNKFELLWRDAVDISQEYVETINHHTWLNDSISPYEIYLKFLYEYLKEDLNIDEDIETYLPPGFMELKYQKQAVVSARKILEAHNGVFLADVVGLGKTYISALLAQQLPGKILIVCPPILKDYWYDTFFDFGIRSFKVVSLGKLDEVIDSGHFKYDYVFIDEAHRFRNEITRGYEQLHQICFGKKVILVSATPLNNKIDDIFSQLKLFQTPKRSTIPGIPDLEHFFQTLKSGINKYPKGDPEHVEAVKKASREIREKILKYVMVRRTRSSIQKYFAEDIEQQGLFFPEMEDPQRLIYEFDRTTDAIFNQTIELIKGLSYSRYTPLLYLKEPLPEFEKQSQLNLGGFMKSVLVKRLESSFHAFRRTLDRFVQSYDNFITMYQGGAVYISREIDVFSLLENDDELRLLELVDKGKVEKYDASLFRDEFIYSLVKDYEMLQTMQELWNQVTGDPKLEELMLQLGKNKLLKRRKLIIFTESRETGEYLLEHLDQKYPGKTFFYCSAGGWKHTGTPAISVNLSKDLIRANFDAGYENPANEVQILITTDVLAEGVNLHRSNIIINYDLPWNPTRVLQRVGRINRVGTAHQRILIFNFFPTAQTDKELGLEENIKTKIQAFHDALGEDARYLTDEEVITTHDILGAELYRRLNDKNLLQGEDEEERTELEQLQLLRQLRDQDPVLFERIKKLPRKARSGRALPENKGDQLITFFRKGHLKRIFITGGEEAHEISFFEAADLLDCKPGSPRINIPRYYYELLEFNKEAFDLANSGEYRAKSRGGGRSNEKYIMQLLKTNDIRYYPGYTDEDEDFLQDVRRVLEDGAIARNTAKRIKQELDKLKDQVTPLRILGLLRKNIPPAVLTGKSETSGGQGGERREVILSEYLQGGTEI